MHVSRFTIAEAGPADLADPAINVALAWIAAADAADRADLEDLSAPDVRIAGPRGDARGREHLAGWLDRAGLALRPTRVHASGAEVVVAVDARWGPDGPWRPIALGFTVEAGLVAAVRRHDDLAEALATAGL